ncbi:MAG: response regulator [Deltaproteobacteria bacterium]|jgi:response regulator RpfG family c-di-GMP phosphodiesterase|nr:response regulator [Deltaproteobacteria bacterium]
MKKKWNILVADDESEVRTSLKESLEEIIACTVHTASDGIEAFERVRSVPLDCCFVDLRMPRLDGLQLTEKIREYDNTVPVVIITGYASLDVAIDTMRRGASDFLIKPFSLKDVMVSFKKVTKERALLIENVFLKQEVEKKKDIERLNVELGHKIREVTQFKDVMQQFLSVRSNEELYRRILDMSAKITASGMVSLRVLDKEKDELEMFAAIPSKEEWAKKIPIDLDRWIADKVTKEGVILSTKEISVPSEIANLFAGDKEPPFLVSIPLKIKNKVVGVLNCAEKQDGGSYSDNDLRLLDFLSRKASLTIENLGLYESLSQHFFSTLYALVETIEARDPYTSEHSRRVTDLSIEIARAMRCSDNEVEILGFAGYLHDIGKIGIRDNILLKRSHLTDEEYDIIKLHPVIGSAIIGHVGSMHTGQAIIRHHHERWDGKGYPDGLKGESIPLLSRIMSVADAFDAMTSDRPYRNGSPGQEAIARIKQNAGKQFDRNVVDAFELVLKEMPGEAG